MMKFRRLVTGFLLLTSAALAASSSDLHDFYQKNLGFNAKSLDDRIIFASQYFLGRPYQLGALGEGPKGQFDQHPLYRSDAFDCVTFVETVLALSCAKTFPEFETKMLDLRYRDGIPKFTHRNHFTSVDWNPNNEAKKYIRNITDQFVGENGEPVTVESIAVIDKPSWYQHFTTNDLFHLSPLKPTDQERLLQEWRDLGKLEKAQKSIIRYLPLTALFDKRGKSRQKIFRQFPKVSIVEIVRPNWDLRSVIGTRLQISHMGFAIRNENDLIFRNASSIDQRVSDTSLTNYLRQYLKNSTVRGIIVLSIE